MPTSKLNENKNLKRGIRQVEDNPRVNKITKYELINLNFNT